MFPIGDDNVMLRLPIVTIALLAALTAVWALIQGGGLDPVLLAKTICDYGMVPGEITRQAPVGTAVPLGRGLECVVDRDAINAFTPITSMCLHGGWFHLIGNGLFLWVFGKSIEDSMGRARYVVFYLLCGLGAAAAQIGVSPGSPVPMVGASGAISGILGAYLVLYPRARVRMLFILFIFIRVIPLPAWLVLIYWIGTQILAGLPEVMSIRPEVSSGVAFWAHIGGFTTGLILIWAFRDPRRVEARNRIRHHLDLYA